MVGSSAGVAGDIWTAETYAGDQYSQVEVTSTQLTGGQWIGPAVRAQNGGQDTYLGIYFWNSGSPQLRLYKTHRGHLDPARQLVQLRAAGGRDEAAAGGGRLQDFVPANGVERYRAPTPA